MISDTFKIIGAAIGAVVLAALYLLSKKKPEAAIPEAGTGSGGTTTGSESGTQAGTQSGTGTTTDSNSGTATPQQTPDQYCKAKYGSDAYYDASLNTCVKRASASAAAAAANVQTDSFNVWYADVLAKYGINPATVAAVDFQDGGGAVKFVYKDGSSKTFPNPATLPYLAPGTRIIAPESSRQATPVNISPPQLGSSSPAPEIRADTQEYLSEYADWTHVTVNYGSNTSVYVYAGGLCNQYGTWYPGYEGTRSPIEAYDAAQRAANDAYIRTPKTCPPGYHWDEAFAVRAGNRDAGCVPDAVAVNSNVNATIDNSMSGKDCETYALTKGAKGSTAYNIAIADCRQKGGYN